MPRARGHLNHARPRGHIRLSIGVIADRDDRAVGLQAHGMAAARGDAAARQVLLRFQNRLRIQLQLPDALGIEHVAGQQRVCFVLGAGHVQRRAVNVLLRAVDARQKPVRTGRVAVQVRFDGQRAHAVHIARRGVAHAGQPVEQPRRFLIVPLGIQRLGLLIARLGGQPRGLRVVRRRQRKQRERVVHAAACQHAGSQLLPERLHGAFVRAVLFGAVQLLHRGVDLAARDHPLQPRHADARPARAQNGDQDDQRHHRHQRVDHHRANRRGAIAVQPAVQL